MQTPNQARGMYGKGLRKMPVVSCGCCGNSWNASFFDSWLCGCGAGWWGIGFESCTASELEEVASVHVAAAGALSAHKWNGSILVLSHAFDSVYSGRVNDIEALVDTLLLFFDRVVLAGPILSDIEEAIGPDKFHAYRSVGILGTCQTHEGAPIGLLERLITGEIDPPITDSEFRRNHDLIAWEPSLESVPEISSLRKSHGPTASVLENSITNLVTLQSRVFVQEVSRLKTADTPAVNVVHEMMGRNLPTDVVDQYASLFRSNRAVRCELLARLHGLQLLADREYNVLLSLARLPRQARASGSIELALFEAWRSSHSIPQRVIDFGDVLEFREKHGLLTSFVSSLCSQLRQRNDLRTLLDTILAFNLALDKRIEFSERVSSGKYDRKVLYLRGLVSTLGGILGYLGGGIWGPIVGGLGGAAISDLCVAYDRRIPPAVAFIADHYGLEPGS